MRPYPLGPAAGAALLMLAALGACARATSVATPAGEATDGPGASAAAPPGSAASGTPAARATPPAALTPPPAGSPARSPEVAPPAALPVVLPPVPPAEITDIDLTGLRVEMVRFKRAGRPVLVNYWATWCGACVHELPELGEMARAWGDDGPAILGVSLDRLTAADDREVRAKVQKMLLRARVSYPNRIIRGNQPDILKALAVGDGIPVSILYDAAGREAARWAGGVSREGVAEAVRRLGAGSRATPDQTRGAGDAGS